MTDGSQPIKNARNEAFSQNLAQGMSAAKAHPGGVPANAQTIALLAKIGITGDTAAPFLITLLPGNDDETLH